MKLQAKIVINDIISQSGLMPSPNKMCIYTLDALMYSGAAELQTSNSKQKWAQPLLRNLKGYFWQCVTNQSCPLTYVPYV